ncbi:MAG: polysaccharide lyase, partial [Myxococcota bacterium]
RRGSAWLQRPNRHHRLTQPAACTSPCLRVLHSIIADDPSTAVEEGGTERVVQYNPLARAVDGASLRFDVYFPRDFDFARGGKLMGLSGGIGASGCADVQPDVFSMRAQWMSDGELVLYAYDQDRVSGECGRKRYAETDGERFRFQRGRWHRVNLQLLLNTGPTRRDGVAELYVDGQQLVKWEGLRLWSASDAEPPKIDQFVFSTFFGGSTASYSPREDSFTYFDNFSVYELRESVSDAQSYCESVLDGAWSDTGACCPRSICGDHCGGPGCGSGGKGDNCCLGSIRRACAEEGVAPCLLDGADLCDDFGVCR